MATSEHPILPPNEFDGADRDRLAVHAQEVESVQRGNLAWGDWLLITTRNSTYTLLALDDDTFAVSGGWFDERGGAPQRMRVNGCTWGGTAIKQDVLAARGLFLEFGNRVVTTRIESVRILRSDDGAPAN
ncbi:MAG: hypothetical protein K8J08_03730 [Thermoanaerobaculia bacterium]|nr:hypothetical protein [Thermoanaerobaculia bacterium]